METAERDSSTAVTRSQHVLYVLPPDRGSIPQFMGPLVSRIDRDMHEPQLLVVTPDAELALAIVSAGNDHDRPVSVLPVAGPKRAARLLQARPAQLVAGDAPALLELLKSASLKLDNVRGIVLAWADHIFDAGDGEALDALLGELPKEAARALVVERLSSDVESLVERHLRRARRVEPAAAAEGDAGTVSLLVAGPDARRRALRRLIEELDPPTALVLASSDEAEREARDLVVSIGHGADESVKVSRVAHDAAGRSLVVVYGLPASREALVHVATAAPARVVAIVEARQIGSLRAMTGGAVTPFVFPEAARGARDREQRLRDELRNELAGGTPAREMLTIEPLLDEFDGVELAAAALRMLDRARSSSASVAVSPVSVAPTGGEGFVKMFVTIGSRDGASPGALVGAITGEADIRSNRLGKIEIRESFSLVEVAAPDVEKVIAAMNGAQVSGRRVAARLERDGPGGGGGGADRGDRGSRPPPRGGPRGREGGDRPRGPGGPRGAGASRGGPARGGPREDRGPRSGRPPARGPGPRSREDREKLPSEREQWSTRGDALRNAKRPRKPREDRDA